MSKILNTGAAVKKTTVDPAKLDPPSNPDGVTNAGVHQALTTGAAEKQAAALAAKHPNVHDLKGELQALYESMFGKTRLDALDWHWQATNLLHHLKNQKAPAPAAASG
jgi:hypothetical protein